MTIPIEPIGSIPRTSELLRALEVRDGNDPTLRPIYDRAIRETIEPFEATGSPVLTDGEQCKDHNSWTYCVPAEPLPHYPRDWFIDDLLHEHETEVRNCLRKGAHSIEIDLTAGGLALVGTFLWCSLARPMIAGSRRFATTGRRRARPRSRRSARTCRGRRWRRTCSEAVDGKRGR